MLKISKLTDYSLVLLATLAEASRELKSARSLSLLTGLKQPTVTKLLKLLVKKQFCVSERGNLGGYRLNLAPEQLSLRTVIEALEGPIAVTECTQDVIHCEVANLCRIRPRWQPINHAVCKALDGLHLSDLISPRSLGHEQIKPA